MHRPSVSSALFVLAVSLAAATPSASAAQATATPTGSSSIVGEARGDNGQPIFRALISIDALHRTVTTDSLGRFGLSELPSGTHRVRFRAINYQPMDTLIVLGAGQTVEWRPTAKTYDLAAERATAYAARAAAGGVDSVAMGRVTLDTSLAFDYASFGVRLLAAVVRKSADTNRVLSPLSAGQALALAMGASKDSTTTVMARALGLGALDQSTLAKRTQWFNRSLAGRKDLTLTVANALWVDTSETLQRDFATWARTYYDASVRAIALHSPTTGATLNRWADSTTRGRIKSVRDKPFADSVKAVLTNAVYLKGTWLTPFEKKLTEDAHFTAADGRRVKVPMMHGGGRLAYQRQHGYQVVRLPYRTGLTAMYVVLPDSSIPAASVMDSLERYGWPTPSPRAETREISLALPRFRVEQRTDLEPPLSAIGMGIIFDSARADFGGLLAPSPNRPPPCPPISTGSTGEFCTRVRIDDATQNVFIDVDEVGTEAAAVTVLSFEVVMTSMGPPPMQFIVDRPFLFAIRDERTGTLLFTGYVANPKS